jgi:RNA polymerase sigma-70 factor (ECF subfamily)
LIHAAVAITGNDTVGRDLAGQLYAELYGLTEREGQRRSPLASYKGRGSLIGWLRTTLAQRHVDHFRRSHREEPIEEYDAPGADPEPAPVASQLLLLTTALESALGREPPEVRFLLASYYLDGRTLAEIAQVIRVHEATVSRKLHRAIDGLRKQVLKNLESAGLSRRAARESLGADPRDLNMNLKKLLQNPPSEAFQEKVTL